MTDVIGWVSCHVYISATGTYLTMVNQCLVIFFPKNYVSFEISQSDEAKKT